MRILYIVPFVPWEIKVRSFNLIPRLARHHQITLVCVSGSGPTADQNAWQSKFCTGSAHVRHSPAKGVFQCAVALLSQTPLRIAYCTSTEARAAVRQACREVRPDVVYVERWRALQFVPPECDAPIVCDPTDSMTLYNRRLMTRGEWWEKLIGWEEYTKFLRYEGKLARQADACVFCSQVDLECVKEQAPEARCEQVPNGVDCEKYFFKDESAEEPGAIVFTGSFKYRPNRHAAEYFLEKVLPIVRHKVPDAKFVAVGNGATKALARYRGTPGFTALDFVPELRPYLAKASVAVAPLTVGSGVSNKIVEAFATGTPIVATSIACGDLPVRDGEHLLIANDPQKFAESVISLLQDRELRRRLTIPARRLVAEQYDWEIVYRKMESIFFSAIEEKKKAIASGDAVSVLAGA
jgi:glycosyltransferase involved in cell wall biosynthesis